jgi:hypothetical protein
MKTEEIIGKAHEAMLCRTFAEAGELLGLPENKAKALLCATAGGAKQLPLHLRYCPPPYGKTRQAKSLWLQKLVGSLVHEIERHEPASEGADAAVSFLVHVMRNGLRVTHEAVEESMRAYALRGKNPAIQDALAHIAPSCSER